MLNFRECSVERTYRVFRLTFSLSLSLSEDGGISRERLNLSKAREARGVWFEIGTLHRVNYFLATRAVEEILRNSFLVMEVHTVFDASVDLCSCFLQRENIRACIRD